MSINLLDKSHRKAGIIMKRLWKQCMLTLFVLFTLVGCSNEEGMNWLFFSQIPSEAEADVAAIVNEVNTSDSADALTIQLISPAYERLINEIASHHGDILFIDESMLYPAVLDPEGLVPLDEIAGEEFATLPSDYKAVHPDTGEEHVYVLPIENDSRLLSELGIETTNKLLALIPIYSDYSKQSLEVLKKLAEKQK